MTTSKVTFIGYTDNKDINSINVEKTEVLSFKSIQYLLSQIDKGIFFDIAFIDFDNILPNDISYLSNIKVKNPSITIIIEYETLPNKSTIIELISIGIYSFLEKNKHQYSQIIGNVINGLTLISNAKIIDVLIQNKTFIQSVEAINQVDLSDTEFQILILLSRGESYEDIARKLEMKIDRFRYYIKKLYKKIQVHNKARAVDYYYRYLKRLPIKT